MCRLEIAKGHIQAYVSGSELYEVTINIKPIALKTWGTIKGKCQGQIGSMLELLQGRISNHVMAVVSDRKQGLFPQPGEIRLECSCPDWATNVQVCGGGALRRGQPACGVDAEELIAADVTLQAAVAAGTPTGKAIARLRNSTKLSLHEFARALTATPQTVQRWENTLGPLRIQTRPLNALSAASTRQKLRG